MMYSIIGKKRVVVVNAIYKGNEYIENDIVDRGRQGLKYRVDMRPGDGAL